MSTIRVGTARPARRDPVSSLVSRGLLRVQRAVDLLLIWQQRARDRRQLEALSDRMLRDIGLTRADVFAEASKPFWRP
jgi:uncharacterized protein YjiS (DUF1127 family)